MILPWDACESHKMGGYPYGRQTEVMGIVCSPYYPYSLIDVRDAPPGALVIDPSTGLRFVRP